MATTLINVEVKARKVNGVLQPAYPSEFYVDLTPGKSIQVFRKVSSEHKLRPGTRFEIGDPAEYDSFNLQYIGEIESITAKSVTIVKKRGVSDKKYRLDLYQFCLRNFSFNLEAVQASNRIESQNI